MWDLEQDFSQDLKNIHDRIRAYKDTQSWLEIEKSKITSIQKYEIEKRLQECNLSIEELQKEALKQYQNFLEIYIQEQYPIPENKLAKFRKRFYGLEIQTSQLDNIETDILSKQKQLLQEKKQEQWRKIKGKILLCIVVIFLVPLSLCTTIYLLRTDRNKGDFDNSDYMIEESRPDPELFLENYFRTLQEQEFYLAWTMLTKNFKIENKIDDFQKYEQFWNNHLPIKIVDIKYIDEDDNVVKIYTHWKVCSKEDRYYYAETINFFYLVWEDQTWKINRSEKGKKGKIYQKTQESCP